MEIEILQKPIQFKLWGVKGVVENERYGEVGMRLMNEMWPIVKSEKLSTTGINHWIYLPDCVMFTGVELKTLPQSVSRLEPLEFELHRYLKHVHVGPYQELPAKWKALKAEVTARGEVMSLPSLEIYGHHSDESSKVETTILIGLQ